MFCSKCGAQIPDDAQHCPQCGAQVEPVAPAPVPAPQAAPAPAPAPKKKFTGNKVYLLLVVAMFISAFVDYWLASVVLMAIIAVFVKDRWCIRNAVQPFAVGALLAICQWVAELLQNTATVSFTGAFGRVLFFILEYSLELVRFAGIVFLIIGLVTLFSGETRVPIFSALAKHFPDEEKKEEA